MSRSSVDYIEQMILKLEYAKECFNSGSFQTESDMLEDCKVLLDRAVSLNKREKVTLREAFGC